MQMASLSLYMLNTKAETTTPIYPVHPTAPRWEVGKKKDGDQKKDL